MLGMSGFYRTERRIDMIRRKRPCFQEIATKNPDETV